MRAHRVVFLATVTFLVFYHLQRWRWRSKPRVAVAQSRFAPAEELQNAESQFAEALHDAAPPPPPPPPSLTGYPPKNCSMLLFRHLAKSGGSTVQSMLRRNEQTGDLYYASWGTWVEVRPPEWNLLVDEISADVDGYLARHPRTAVSFHKQTAVQFSPENVNRTREMAGQRGGGLFHIWEDIARLRRLYEARGCAFVLATMLRRPDPDLYVSDYLYEGAPSGKSLADWMGRDVQSAQLLGWPHGWNSKQALTPAQRAATYAMLDAFDVVGTTEKFAESVLLMARAAGVPHLQHCRMNEMKGRAKSRTALLRDAAQRAAITRLAAFDAEVYATYAARLDATLARANAPFRARAARLRNATAVTTRKSRWKYRQYYGGAPPDDRFLVTSPYLCKSKHTARKAARVDYGGCDVGLGTPRGPRRLDALKTLVPCAAANCTKMAADDYACGHLLKLRVRICKEVEAATDGNFAAEYFVPGYERLGTNGVSPF